jgi:hypothetical protein
MKDELATMLLGHTGVVSCATAGGGAPHPMSIAAFHRKRACIFNCELRRLCATLLRQPASMQAQARRRRGPRLRPPALAGVSLATHTRDVATRSQTGRVDGFRG